VNNIAASNLHTDNGDTHYFDMTISWLAVVKVVQTTFPIEVTFRFSSRNKFHSNSNSPLISGSGYLAGSLW